MDEIPIIDKGSSGGGMDKITVMAGERREGIVSIPPINHEGEPEPSPEHDTDAREGWVTLREAETLTGVKVRTLRNWYSKGRVQSRLEAGPHGEQRMVRIEEVERAAATTPGRLTGPSAPPATAGPTAATLIPVELLERVEAAWRQVIEAEARARVAEAKLEFEQERRQRLELRLAELEARPAGEPTPAGELPDIDDETVARLAREVEELRRRPAPRPWWRRLSVQVPRRNR